MNNEELRDQIFEKLKKGIKTKYINELVLMKDFNREINPYKQDAILGQFFDEMIRLFLEFKLLWSDEYNFIAASNRLNQYFNTTLKVLTFDFTEAQKRRACI